MDEDFFDANGNPQGQPNSPGSMFKNLNSNPYGGNQNQYGISVPANSNINTNGGMTASGLTQGQLYAQQKQMGGYGAASIQTIGTIAQQQARIKNATTINTNAPTPQLDAFGRPQYNLGTFAAQTAGVRVKGGGAANVASDAGAGLAIGTEILPGWGSLIGTAVGAIYGLASNGYEKNALAKKKNLAYQSLMAGNNVYNAAMGQYNQAQLGKSVYDFRNDPNQREYNVYNSQQVS